MKARRWNIKEDEMVCLFYLQHITDFKKNINQLFLMFEKEGFGDRKKNAIMMRISNYQSLHTKKGLANASKQSRCVYKALVNKI